MTRTLSFLAVLLLVMAPAARAQQRAEQYKDPGTATLLSVVIPGGGQLYSGETGKGAAILGVGLGSLLVGTALYAANPGGVDCNDNLDCSAHDNVAPLLVGSLVYLGAWVYGISDASGSAKRMNSKHGVARLGPAEVTPLVAPSAHGTTLGLSLRM